MEQLIHSLKPHATLRTMKRGSNILFQGEIPRNVYVVRDGFVRAYTVTSTGEERTIAIYGKNDIFPITWIIGETTQSLFYYEAMTDVRALTVTKDVFIEISKSDAHRLQMMLQYIGNQHTAMLFRITGLEQSRAVEKIGYTLYYLLFRYGKQIDDELYRIDIKLTQSTLASLVGLTRESTTKNLNFLKDKKVISYSHSLYTVHKARLESFLKEDSFKDLQI
jgi:CRP/FNR family transcriptional regulator, cyclic AMP receptor protein